MGGHPDRYRVLHVDDDQAFLDVTADFLGRYDHLDVETATSADAGLDRLAEADVDCVVSDHDMPGMDGLEFLDAVREAYGDLPFVLFTGKGSEEVASEAIARGVTDYLRKRTGTEQYELLANRIAHAARQYHATRRAENLDRIRRVIRDVNQALLRAESREEVYRRVCEIFSGAEPYRFAWIGEHDTETRTVEPRTAAGVEEGYLEAITVTTDESATAQGPTGRAVRTGELAVMQDILDDPSYEPWRADALDRGYQSSAAVPIEYEGTQYAILNVYADRPYAFDERERELLCELSGDVAHAIHSIELLDETRRYERLVEHLPVGVYSTTREAGGELLDANQALADIFGAADLDELYEHRVVDLYCDPAERDRLQRELERVEVVRDRELRMKTLDGEEILVAVTAIRREVDGDVYLEGIVQYVTDPADAEG